MVFTSTSYNKLLSNFYFSCADCLEFERSSMDAVIFEKIHYSCTAQCQWVGGVEQDQTLSRDAEML